ncbi:ABC transporter permease [Bosea sp. SSUT16]|jgi:putative spermidine/putrescine transport system permease protein|uniref:ABC transporter permease n=1 Tax=Bosea spartocytisi TaxID=2773451 RepID=A0A927I1H1_9HYPH|nr:ABC transporter permease [Bosea spartocytisi]MBD3847601.1 ABC transporter permease [Bosea spartocytisi]MCT4474409.1 ABC transporter permease [Bosea spartocytisi]
MSVAAVRPGGAAFNALRLAFGALAVAFLLLPLVAILPLAFTDSVFLVYPISGPSMRWFGALAESQAWTRAIVNSLIIGTGATVVATVIGTLAALGLRRELVPFSGLLRSIFLLPMVVPAVVLGVGMQILYARMGLASSYLGVIIAHAVLCVPFVLVNVSGSLASMDPALERAAASLGASPVNVFRNVTLPLAMPGILTGAVFAFATSLDEVVITLFVAGPNQTTLARQMFSSLRENISPAIAAAAFIIMILTFLLLLAVKGAALVQALRRKRGIEGS